MRGLWGGTGSLPYVTGGFVNRTQRTSALTSVSLDVGMGFNPRLRRRGVSLARLVAILVFWRAGLAAWIRAQLPTVIAPDDIRTNLTCEVLAALLAQQRFSREDIRSLENRRSAAIWALARLHGCRLAFSTHRIANPATTGHLYHSSVKRSAISRRDLS